jgi:hypothetical protein
VRPDRPTRPRLAETARPPAVADEPQRRDDLISHLLDEDCSSAEILGECITFAAAGMVTTREFVNVAAWHLFTDDALLDRYRAAEEPERLAILHELLWLEPVVGHLKRRTTAPVELLTEDHETVTVPAQVPRREHRDPGDRRLPHQAVRDPGRADGDAAARVVQRRDRRLRTARHGRRRVSDSPR